MNITFSHKRKKKSIPWSKLINVQLTKKYVWIKPNNEKETKNNL